MTKTYNNIIIASFHFEPLQYGQTYDSHTMTIWSGLDHELNLCNYLMTISCPRVLCPYWHPSTRATPLLPSPSLFPPPLVRAVIPPPLLLPISSYPSLSLLISYPPTWPILSEVRRLRNNKFTDSPSNASVVTKHEKWQVKIIHMNEKWK